MPVSGTVSPSSLTFTVENWDELQTVTVTGADDAIDDDDRSYSILVDTVMSDDPKYNDVIIGGVSVTNIDDDDFGITVDPVDGLAGRQ